MYTSLGQHTSGLASYTRKFLHVSFVKTLDLNAVSNQNIRAANENNSSCFSSCFFLFRLMFSIPRNSNWYPISCRFSQLTFFFFNIFKSFKRQFALIFIDLLFFSGFALLFSTPGFIIDLGFLFPSTQDTSPPLSSSAIFTLKIASLNLFYSRYISSLDFSEVFIFRLQAWVFSSVLSASLLFSRLHSCPQFSPFLTYVFSSHTLTSFCNEIHPFSSFLSTLPLLLFCLFDFSDSFGSFSGFPPSQFPLSFYTVAS